MKLIALALVLTCGSTIAAESTVACPANSTEMHISMPQPRGLWGVFKKKRGKSHRPAYSRIR